ncbi:Oxidoreductase [Sporothrix stenoceras]|uniref:Mitochondrial intermembrane space import and assembly protein 40 n=1 Tax=Sporothrix stenoceras TaxID=5173 RepID=A0ABR3ZBD9_9PEZI
MYRASLRSSAQLARAVRHPAVSGAPRRFASTAAGSSGTWKGAVARWGIAGAALYWYNTSPVFADEAARHKSLTPPTTTDAATISPQDSEFRTVDSLLEDKQRAESEKKAAAAAKNKKADTAETTSSKSTPPTPGGEGVAVVGDGSPEALEQEASQQGAFNPETGEINWDCPCLGGMADGPCGEDFKAAFSCFVYSTEEPKGMDCIEKFQHMQDCFRKYPEIYGAELQDDEQDGENAGPDNQQPSVEGVPEGVAASESQPKPASVTAAAPSETTTAETEPTAKSDATAENSAPAPAPAAAAEALKDDVVQAESSYFDATEQKPVEAADDNHVPTAAFDATGANKN